jgi:CheY-like chemotaxis protein
VQPEMTTAKTIMIVDDEPDIRYVLQKILNKNGYSTIEAPDGAEALRLVNLKAPDAIILDLMMPQLDGFSVNLKLKENPVTAAIPVIVITGKGHLKELMDIREDLKVAAYFEKPFQVANLIKRLKEIFEGR